MGNIAIVLAFPISFILFYTLFEMLQRKSVVRQAVLFNRAYWDEEERRNNKRLFGKEDI